MEVRYFWSFTKEFALTILLISLIHLSPYHRERGVDARKNKPKWKKGGESFAIGTVIRGGELKSSHDNENALNISSLVNAPVSNRNGEIAFRKREPGDWVNRQTRFECTFPPGENITRFLFIPCRHPVECQTFLECVQRTSQTRFGPDSGFTFYDDQQNNLELCGNLETVIKNQNFVQLDRHKNLSDAHKLCYSSAGNPKPGRCRFITIAHRITTGLVFCQSQSTIVHDFIVLSPIFNRNDWFLLSKMTNFTQFIRLRFRTKDWRATEFFLNEKVEVFCDVPQILYPLGSRSMSFFGHYKNGEMFRIAEDPDSYEEFEKVGLHQLKVSFRILDNMSSVTCQATVLDSNLSWSTVQQTANLTVFDQESLMSLWPPMHPGDELKYPDYSYKGSWACNFTGSDREKKAARKNIAEYVERRFSFKVKKSDYGDTFIYLLRGLNRPRKANYTCEALVMENSVQSDFYVKLDPQAPSIEKPRHQIWVLPREQNHTLDCYVKGEPKPSIRWLKDNKELWHTVGQSKVEKTLARLNTTTVAGTLTSTSSVDLEDPLLTYVNFTCVASNFLGSSSLQFILVNSSRPFIMKKAKDLNQELVVMDYGEERQHLTCQYEGGPLTKVLWLFNNKTRLEESDRKLGVNLSESSILLERINKSAEGSYTCLVSNDYGSDNYSFNLAVHYEKPQILNVNEQLNFEIMEENQNITCTFRGTPKPSLIWYHDGIPVSESFNRTLKENLAFESVIEIPIVQSSDGGIYTCFVFNEDDDISSDSAKFNFTVTTSSDLFWGIMSRILFLTTGGTILLLILAMLFGLVCFYNAKAKSLTHEVEDIEMEAKFEENVRQFLTENPGFIEELGLQMEVPILIDFSNEYRISDDSEVTLDETSLLGVGEFGEVFRGEFRGEGVAIKVMSSSSKFSRWKSFLDEIKAMVVLNGDDQHRHKNIVKLLGVRIDLGEKNVKIVMELCLTSLKSHLEAREMDFKAKLTSLKSNVRHSIESTFAQWCSQIACGMAYLGSKGIIHRDLAARNVLLSMDGVVKISDFGLSRLLLKQPNPQYYRLLNFRNVKLPQCWCAYESLLTLKFTKESDVWMFAVCCWEIYSVGQEPFQEFPDWDRNELIYRLKKGTRLEKPEFFQNYDILYEMLCKCWDLEPKARPTFEELEAFFQSPLPYQTRDSSQS